MTWFNSSKVELPPISERYRILTDGVDYKVEALIMRSSGFFSRSLMWEYESGLFHTKGDAIRRVGELIIEAELNEKRGPWRVI